MHSLYLPRHFSARAGPKLIFSDLVGISYWIAALVLAGIIVVILVGLETWSPWHGELGNDVDGDLLATPPQGKTRMHAQPAE
jgi:hypothetical protein